jgi:hypothetical protein
MSHLLSRAGVRKAVFLVALIALVMNQSGFAGPDAAYAAQARQATVNAGGRLASPSERLVAASPTLAISSIADNRGDYSGGAVPAYAKLEVTFQVTGSVAADTFQPFTTSPPAGVAPGLGITVDGELSLDNFQTILRQPAFFAQQFQYIPLPGADWLYPTTSWAWTLRFAPPTAGTWQYRIRATDASGTTVSAPVSVTVAASASHGVARVSPTDARYFEFSDGTYLPALGFNMNFDHISWTNPVQSNRAQFQALGANGVQVVRQWLSQWGIYGSSNAVWTSPERGADYAPFATVDPVGRPGFAPVPGNDVAAWLQVGWNHSLLLGSWLKGAPAVKPSTTYHVRVRYQIPTALAGPVSAGKPFGLVVKLGGTWLNRPQDAGTGVPVTPYVAAATGGWQTLEGSFTTGSSQVFLADLYVALENATTDGGTNVYIDRVDIEEDLGNGQFGANIVSKPSMAQHQYVDQALSRSFDLMLQEAETQGIMMKLVLLEKDEFILDHIGLDGQTVPRGTGSTANFYGSGHTLTRGRWLQQAWWRYVQARWGYSTAIHSWELLNEGDPFNGNHAALADELAVFMHQFSPSHLVTTSTWHSLPHSFWDAAPHVDYVDVHQYLQEGQTINTRVDTAGLNSVTTALPSDFYDSAAWAERISLALGALSPSGLRKPTMRGESGLASASTTDSPAPQLAADTQGIWLHKWLWAQLNAGGLIDSGWWYDRANIFDRTDNTPNLLAIFKRYFTFIKDIPLSNGHSVDSAASVSAPSLRVRGQKDPLNGRAHLWIDNRGHTWKTVVDGLPVTSAGGTVTLPGMPGGAYQVTWYDPYQGATTSTQQVATDAGGTLSLDLPQQVATDIAVRIDRLQAGVTPTPSTGPTLTPTTTPSAPSPTATPSAPVPTATPSTPVPTATPSAPPPAATPAPTNAPGTPMPTPSAPSCVGARPPISVTTRPGGNGSIIATIDAGVGSIAVVQTGPISNATVEIASGMHLASNSTVDIQPRSRSIELTASPLNPGGEIFVPLVVRDDCGDWQTFFGKGR